MFHGCNELKVLVWEYPLLHPIPDSGTWCYELVL